MKKIKLNEFFRGLDKSAKFLKYRELWHELDSYSLLTDFPLHLDVELSGVCNLKCESCFQHLITEPLGLMKMDLFKKIIDEGAEKGLCAIKLQIRGESFLHNQLFDCIRYAKDKGILDVQVTTNGTFLGKDTIELILSSGLDAIIFSVDGHHAESLDRKDNSSQQEVEENIRYLLAEREARKNSNPWVRLRTCIQGSNKEEYAAVKENIKERFPLADIVTVGRIHNFKDDEDSFPDLHTNYVLNPCTYLLQRLAIFWNGNATTCCMDYNNKFELGNVGEKGVQSIWLSNKMEVLREGHKQGKRIDTPICKHCLICTIRKDGSLLLDTTPRHSADYKLDAVCEKGESI